MWEQRLGQVLYTFVSFYCNWNILQRFFFISKNDELWQSRDSMPGVRAGRQSMFLSFLQTFEGSSPPTHLTNYFFFKSATKTIDGGSWGVFFFGVPFHWHQKNVTTDSTTRAAAVNTVAVIQLNTNYTKYDYI